MVLKCKVFISSIMLKLGSFHVIKQIVKSTAISLLSLLDTRWAQHGYFVIWNAADFNIKLENEDTENDYGKHIKHFSQL